jgi:hypothetical protein
MEINRSNYETFFLLYLDRELNASEMMEVENFVDANADLQKEFSLLSQTILIPAQTEFSQKELLFRKEDKRRVVPIYWTRIAAAVAVLVLGGWLISTQLAVKQDRGMAGSDSKKNMVLIKKNGPGQRATEANNHLTGPAPDAVNKIEPAVRQDIKTEYKNHSTDQQNSTIPKNQSVRNSVTAKSNIKPLNDLPGKNNDKQLLVSGNPDQQTPLSGDYLNGSNLAIQKSSAQGLQPVNSRNAADLKQISALPGSHSPVLLIAAGTGEKAKNENAVFAENEDQTDNAISVVALNDKNKGITKLFKKLTTRAPADENERKVRVSVFQFSY